MQAQPDLFQEGLALETDPRELYRKDAPDTSVEAAHSGDKTGDAALIYGLIRKAGHPGLTAKEAAVAMGKPLNAISGRFSNLQRKTLIKPCGLKRDRSRAFVLQDRQLRCDCGVEISDEQAELHQGQCDHCAAMHFE